MVMTTRGKGCTVKTFVFVVYVLFGVLAAVAVFAGIAMLISGFVGGGIVAVVLAAVLALMSMSVRRTHSSMS